MGGLAATGFPIRTPLGQWSLSTSPKIFAASHVLHRLYAPRHPPSALSNLTIHNRSRLGLDLRALAMSHHVLGSRQDMMHSDAKSNDLTRLQFSKNDDRLGR